ncbi:peptide deformylase, mitochondrial-like isoform X2 [Saccoglossus kowalevskii]
MIRTEVKISQKYGCRGIVPEESLPRRVMRSVKYRSQLWKPKMKVAPYNHVCQVGDPVLRGKAVPVDPSDIGSNSINQLIEQMVAVMRRGQTVGLSAPQIGVGFQVIVMEYKEKHMQMYSPAIIQQRGIKEFPLKIFINPQMKVLDYTKVIQPEGCESIKGYSAYVERHYAVEITGLSPTGEMQSWKADGFPARIIQHEMDHLQGRLYIDIMDPKSFVDDSWRQWNLE